MAIKLGNTNINVFGNNWIKAYLGNTLVLGGGVQYILDLYPNAASAYSLRQLKTGVEDVVRVRRSSDNTEQDFTPSEVTDGTLTTFTGVGDGFVTVWYDQSGEGINMLNTTASSQPQIVSNGALILENGNPSLLFDSSFLYAWNNVSPPLIYQDLSGEISIIAVERTENTTDTGSLTYSGSTMLEFRQNGGGGSHFPFNVGYDNGGRSFVASSNYTAGASKLITPLVTNNTLRLSTSFVDGDNVKIYLDSISELNDNLTLASGDRSVGVNNSTLCLGARSTDAGVMGGTPIKGSIQEVIIYKSKEESNRVGIETDINNHYTIY